MSSVKGPGNGAPLIGYPGQVAARLIDRVEQGQRVAPAVRRIAEAWAGGRIVPAKLRLRPDVSDLAANDTSVGGADGDGDGGMVVL